MLTGTGPPAPPFPGPLELLSAALAQLITCANANAIRKMARRGMAHGAPMFVSLRGVRSKKSALNIDLQLWVWPRKVFCNIDVAHARFNASIGGKIHRLRPRREESYSVFDG